MKFIPGNLYVNKCSFKLELYPYVNSKTFVQLPVESFVMALKKERIDYYDYCLILYKDKICIIYADWFDVFFRLVK